mgnify:CR=1 FL=1
MKKYTKILVLLLILIPIVVPVAVFAVDPPDAGAGFGQFIPCDGVKIPCDFTMLLKLVKNVLDWVVMISFPAAIISFAWAGFNLLTNGISDKRTEAKKMLWKIVIGFAIILAAWLIVRTIVGILLADGYGNQFIVF